MRNWIINTNDLISIYIGFSNQKGGKVRPVLIINKKGTTLFFYRITSKYQEKSTYIKEQYYPLQDWKLAGLNKPSYVDVGTLLSTEISSFNHCNLLGQISVHDAQNLFVFAKKLYKKRNT